MKFIELKCNKCGADLTLNSELKQIICQYCGNIMLLNDEIQHVQYDNMGQSGYDFEMGRLKAQDEYNKQKIKIENEKKRKAAQIRNERLAKVQRERDAQRKSQLEKEKQIRIIITALTTICIILSVLSCGFVNPIFSIISIIVIFITVRFHGITQKQNKCLNLLLKINFLITLFTAVIMIVSSL